MLLKITGKCKVLRNKPWSTSLGYLVNIHLKKKKERKKRIRSLLNPGEFKPREHSLSTCQGD